jgi:hypothetical protein
MFIIILFIRQQKTPLPPETLPKTQSPRYEPMMAGNPKVGSLSATMVRILFQKFLACP